MNFTHILMPPRSGKTTSINDNSKPDTLVITKRTYTQARNMYKAAPTNILFVGDGDRALRGKSLKSFTRIYI